MSIRLLPDDVIDRIAAGEVVERPASVLKELIENALDAGATDIRVEIVDGGRELIRVADDGCGMDRADAKACFQRHATSKIRSDEDLLTIATLGFRGEAIPSIASVSRMRVITRPAQETEGTCIEVNGSIEGPVEPIGCAPGTEISVRTLFYNVPARRRFLRTAPTEASHCTEAVVRQALIRPDVGFSMSHQGRVTVRAPKAEAWRDRAADLLGPHALRLTPTVAEEEGRILNALVSPVGLHRRASTGANYHYVNGRFVRDPLLRRAVTEAYREVVPKGRHPVVVLDLRVPPDTVDVNVHPHKTEVRFRRPRDVHAFIVRSLRTAIQAALPPDQPIKDVPRGQQIALLGGKTPTEAPRRPGISPLPSGALVEAYASLSSLGEQTGPDEPTASSSNPAPVAKAADAPLTKAEALVNAAPPTSRPLAGDSGQSSEAVDAPVERPPRFLGVLHHVYWICELADGLGVIDPYVLRERVVRQALSKDAQSGPLESQPLLLPAIVSFDSDVRDAVLNIGVALRALGLEIEAFDGTNLALKSVPDALQDFDADMLLREIGDACALGGVELPDLIAVLARHDASCMDVSVPAKEIVALLADAVGAGMGSNADPPCAVVRFDLEQLESAFRPR